MELTHAMPRAWGLREEGPRRSGAAVGLSVLLHLLFCALFLALSALGARRPARAQGQVVSLRSISDAQWQRLREVRSTASTATARVRPPDEAKRHEPMPKGQVVDVQQGNGRESPDAKYLAESSNSVAKQTRARETTAFYDHAMAKASTTTPQPIRSEPLRAPSTRGNHGAGEDDRPMERAVRARAQAKQAASELKGITASSLLDHHPLLAGAGLLARANAAQQAPEEAPSEGRRGEDAESSMASHAALASESGAPANDHLENVDEGDGTFLNTREWKYAGFFNRVKQSVSAHWDPQRAYQRRGVAPPETGQTRYTVVSVVLDVGGGLKEVHVERSSGTDALDEEAVAAFERSQPFPNPPRGLVGRDSTIRFNFGFYMETSGATMFRPFQFHY